MTTRVVFIQGGGAGAYDEDALLVDSLRQHLGAGFSVDFPRMPDEDEPDYERWRPAVACALTHAGSEANRVVLVGHSVGGYVLLKYLASERLATRVDAVCIIAAPFPGGDAAWTFDGFDLPEDLAGSLPSRAPVFLYASEDDDVVPFAHRGLYAAALPQATTRTTSGGHQLGDDLHSVAADIAAVVEG